ncbi:alpha/beta fold hydrolase [Verrucomicrobium spinosum]|uniref:alpha/beta fold hydrolase n=2 Tax=Verrucomicrobium spinosum TaxID=2736 RepID=UPI00017468F4|nr:alpha/beta fold hydrolase [Verrucomicrobium spinosum]
MTPPTPSTSSVVKRLGCPLHFKISGHTGPKVLFIQGTGLHGDGWLPQVEELSKDHQCLTFDNRGIGRSLPVGQAEISVPQMAMDARAVLDHVGWESAHVVGHSLGGLVALQLALTERARVASLALLCTFADGRAATGMTWPKLWVGLRSYLGTRAMRRQAFLQMVMPKHHLRQTPDLNALAIRLEPIFGHDLADHPPVEMKQLRAMGGCNLTHRLRELDGLPTMVVTAAHDIIAGIAPGRIIAESIPGATYHALPDAGHGATIQCADQVNAWLRSSWATVQLP